MRRSDIATMMAILLVCAATHGCKFSQAGLPEPSLDSSVPPTDAAMVDGGTVDAVSDGYVWLDGPVETDAGSTCSSLDPPWWNTAWKRRREISMGPVIQDYSVLLTIEDPEYTQMSSVAKP